MKETKKCRECQVDIPIKAIKCSECKSDQRSWIIRNPIKSILLFLFIIIPFVIMPIVGIFKATFGKATPTKSISLVSENNSFIEDEKIIEVIIEEPELVNYEIVEEDDISYANCKRASFRVLVADDADQNDIDYTLEEIAHEKLIYWNDVTLWAYGFSERANATGLYTKGIYMDTLPGFCN